MTSLRDAALKVMIHKIYKNASEITDIRAIFRLNISIVDFKRRSLNGKSYVPAIYCVTRSHYIVFILRGEKRYEITRFPPFYVSSGGI